MKNSIIPFSKLQKIKKSLSLKRNTKTMYIRVTDNVYYDGLSYRVRLQKDNIKFSRNFKSIKLALSYKNNMIKTMSLIKNPCN
jgi:hypothetical protein